MAASVPASVARGDTGCVGTSSSVLTEKGQSDVGIYSPRSVPFRMFCAKIELCPGFGGEFIFLLT